MTKNIKIQISEKHIVIKNFVLEKIFLAFSFLVLISTTTYWTLLSTKVESFNSDQLSWKTRTRCSSKSSMISAPFVTALRSPSTSAPKAPVSGVMERWGLVTSARFVLGRSVQFTIVGILWVLRGGATRGVAHGGGIHHRCGCCAS